MEHWKAKKKKKKKKSLLWNFRKIDPFGLFHCKSVFMQSGTMNHEINIAF